MLKRRHIRVAPRPGAGREAADGTVLLLASLFLLGCLIGSLVSGKGGELSQQLSDLPAVGTDSHADFWRSFFDYTKYELAAFLLGTTTCGVAALPLLCLWKGFVYSRVAAVPLLQSGGTGLLSALVFPGLPALVSIACFLLLSADGFQNARRLCGLVRGAHIPPVQHRLAHAAISLPLLIGGTALTLYLVPVLLSLFHK